MSTVCLDNPSSRMWRTTLAMPSDIEISLHNLHKRISPMFESPRSTTAVAPAYGASQSNPPRLPHSSKATRSNHVHSTDSCRRQHLTRRVCSSRISKDATSASQTLLGRHSLHSWSPVPKPRPKLATVDNNRQRLSTRAHSFNEHLGKTPKQLSPRRNSMAESHSIQPVPSLSAYIKITKMEEVADDCTSDTSICAFTKNGSGQSAPRRFSLSDSQSTFAFPILSSSAHEHRRNSTNTASRRHKQSSQLRPWPTNPRTFKTSTFSLDLPSEMTGDLPIIDQEVITQCSTISTISSVLEETGLKSKTHIPFSQNDVRTAKSSVASLRGSADIVTKAICLADSTCLYDSFPLIEWPSPSTDDEDFVDTCLRKAKQVTLSREPLQNGNRPALLRARQAPQAA